MQCAAGKQCCAFSDVSVYASLRTHATHAAVWGASPPWLIRTNRRARVAVSADAGPSSGLSLAIYRIFRANRTHCPRSKARHNGNSHRTLIAPAIGVTAIADCLLPANWPRNCEYGPIFDPLRPDLKERLRSATPRFWLDLACNFTA